MSCLIYIKNKEQLQFIRNNLPYRPVSDVLYLTLDPQVYYELASDKKAVLWAGDFVGGDDWRKIEDEALSLRDGWYRPVEKSLVYEGINLAELIRLEHTQFFRQAVRARIILERLFNTYQVSDVILLGRSETPCRDGNRDNNKNDVFEGVFLAEAYKRGIKVKNISFEVAPSEPQSPKEANPGEVGDRVFGFDCWKIENSSKLIAVGSPFHLIIMEPFVREWSNQADCEGLLLNLSRSIQQSNKRAGFQLPTNTRFVGVADFSIYNQSVGYVQTQRQMLAAFEQWKKAREKIQDSHMLKNPHLNFHWTFIWNSLMQLPAAVQKAFEALRIMEPDVVLTCEMASSNIRVFTEAAKKKGILTVDCPHGYVGDIEEFEQHGDLYLAWGTETVKQLSQRFKMQKPKITVTGSPINEKVIKSKTNVNPHRLYQKTGLSPNKKTVCVVTRGIFANVWPVNIKEFFARCEEIASLALNQDIQIIIKVSPRVDHVELYKRVFGSYENIYVCTEYSLDELLPVIDIGVMFFYTGTASVLFLHKGIPTIFVRGNSIVSFTDSPWQVFGDKEPISKLCRRFLYDPEARHRRLALQKSFAQQHLYIDDNNVAVRAARTIKDEIKGGQKPVKQKRRHHRKILTQQPQTKPGQIGCLAIFTPQVGKISETFITRQINNIAPDRTVVVTGLMNADVRMQRPYLVIPYSTGPSVYQAEVEDRVVRFLEEHRVTHILCQYGCYGTDIVELNHRLLHLPVFVHFLGCDASAMLREPGMSAYYKWMGTRVTGVIALSEKMASRLAAIGIPPQKIRVIQHGVEIPSAIEARPDKKRCRFVSVTRLVPKKAPLLLLQAFNKVHNRIADCTLDIIGDGPLRQNVQHFVDSYGLSKAVTLHGDQPHECVMKKIHDSCVYVQHSITDPKTGDAEGLPHIILEASAAGLPVVSTLHEGIPDEVQHGVTGFLVEEGDIDAMAEYMTRLAQAPNMRKTMGTAAYEKIADEFAMPVWMQRLRDCLTLSDAGPRLRPRALQGFKHNLSRTVSGDVQMNTIRQNATATISQIAPISLFDAEPPEVVKAKEIIRAYYNKRISDVWAGVNHPVWFDHQIDACLWPRNIFWVERGVFGRILMKTGCSVLDLCCGDGYYSDIWFSTIAGSIDACDNDADALRMACQKHANPKINYHRVDVLADSFPRPQYDVITWFEGIEHFSEGHILYILSKINAALADDGILIGSTPLVKPPGDSKKSITNRQHDREFTSARDLELVLKNVFVNVQTWVSDHPQRTTCFFRALK